MDDRLERFIAIIETLLIPVLLFGPGGITGLSSNKVEGTLNSGENQCVEYDSLQKLIQVRCESIHLTDIYNSLRNPTVLGIERGSDANQPKVWILNAGIVVDIEGSLIIDSSDTSWLKIIPTPTVQLKQKSANATEDTNYSDDTLTVIQNNSRPNSSNTNNITKIENGTLIVSKHNGDNPNGIHVHGSLKIDSVKITSWDPEKNDVISFDYGKRAGEEHTKSDYDTAEPRAFIRVSKDAAGTTNITNSEIAYLGYSCSRCAGLSYYGGEGSIIRNNDIHHLLKGFYSKNAAYITIDNNTFHDNYLYGIDPHTGSHDFSISNNFVYDNNASGIICSKDCYNLMIDGNEVYNNSGAARGIAFSINTTNSVAKNNYVHDQPRCISFNRGSNHNTIFNNTVSNCKTGIFLSTTGNNSIYNNKISNTKNGIRLYNPSNKIYDNEISQSTNGIDFDPMKYTNQTSDAASLTNPNSTFTNHERYLRKIVEDNELIDIENLYQLKKQKQAGTSSCIKYMPETKLIQVFCNSAHISDIARELNDTSILGRETSSSIKKDSTNHGVDNNMDANKVWVLNAGIEIKKGATLIIDSSDTSWLKIVPTPEYQLESKLTSDSTASGTLINATNIDSNEEQDEIPTNNAVLNKTNSIGAITVSKSNQNNPNGIHVIGSLRIDSVKITSWDPEKNDVIKFKLGKSAGEEDTTTLYDTSEARPFIRVSNKGDGTTNITNSELAYLGYACNSCSGLSYYGEEGSVIKDNDIHHLLKGYYSNGVGYMVIEDNKFHDNYLYGIGPHTNSHDLLIKGNVVNNNNASGIICSRHCYNLLVEGNEVYSNSGSGRGIAFSINTTNSTARNNQVYDNVRCVSFNNESNFNKVYNNTISNCKTGVYLSDTSNNQIYDNNIINTTNGIITKNLSNQIHDNEISNSKNGIVHESPANASNNETTNDGTTNKNSFNDIVKNNHIIGYK